MKSSSGLLIRRHVVLRLGEERLVVFEDKVGPRQQRLAFDGRILLVADATRQDDANNANGGSPHDRSPPGEKGLAIAFSPGGIKGWPASLPGPAAGAAPTGTTPPPSARPPWAARPRAVRFGPPGSCAD